MFEIFHISDLHFAANADHANILATIDTFRATGDINAFFPGALDPFCQCTYDREVARALAKFIAEQRTDKALALISGDLAASGLVDNLTHSLGFMEGPEHENPNYFYFRPDGTPTIAATGLKYFIVPGNHDRFDGGNYAAGSLLFDGVFRDHWGIPSPVVKARLLNNAAGTPEIALVAADYCLRSNDDAGGGRLAWLGRGRAYNDIVRRHVDLTKKIYAAHQGIAVVWIVHFPPDQICLDPDLQLVNSDTFVAAVQECEIRLVLSGHIHRPTQHTIAETVFFCAGASTFYKCVNGNYAHILTIANENASARMVSRRDFLYSSSQDKFVEVNLRPDL